MLPNVLMVGTGEYTTGIVSGGGQSTSDKKIGVVALCMMELRRLGCTGKRLAMAGRDGSKFPAVRKHFQDNIGDVYNMDVQVDMYPEDDQVDPLAYITALDTMAKRDICIIFTPDDTHYDIAVAALTRGLHILVTKPIVHTLQQHIDLVALADSQNVLLGIEVHKRWDPIYRDAAQRIIAGEVGLLSYAHCYMSQPKIQLDTFKSWAGISSDISYYLNSHHVDLLVWAFGGKMIPISVSASCSIGVAKSLLGRDCEDSITLQVTWRSLQDASVGTSIFTASWTAPPSDVHSQQRFFLLGQKGQLTVDQAHRGYSMSTDVCGYKSNNPLYMKYTPDSQGHFDGHQGYGYRSFDAFVKAAKMDSITAGECLIASGRSTLAATAILHAGRQSLDQHRTVSIVYDSHGNPCSFE